jgi:hypothetical protein
MKKLITIFLAALVLHSGFLTAQTKESKSKFSFTKVSRDTKREAKKYIKEGWKVMPGALPIEQQLNSAYSKQVQIKDDGMPLWFVTTGSSVAQTEAAAQMQALEVAKLALVSLLESTMKSVIETDLANNQINAQDAASITKSIQVSSNRVSKKLGYIQPLLNIYKPLGNNTEIKVLIGYNYEMARKLVIDEMKLDLQIETDDVRKRYEKFLNPENYNKGKIENTNDKY